MTFTIDISIIIPNLNGASLLPSCLEAVELSNVENAEVVLVDNGSTDESVAVAQSVYPPLILVKNRENLGYATACNQGAAVASGEYLLFLNSDVVLARGCLRDTLEWAREDPEAAVWQPKLLKSDGETWDSAGSLFTKTGFLRHRGLGEQGSALFADASVVFSVKGACMLVRAESFRAVGGFDDQFFAYFEETDLCWRLQMAGWTVRYLPVCCAFHRVGATTTRLFRSEQIDFLSFRNRVTSILKNAEIHTLARILPVHYAACLVTALAFLARGKWRNAGAVIVAIVWPFLHLRIVLRNRHAAQRLRVHRDRAFLPRVTAPMGVTHGRELLKSYLPRW